MQLSLQVSVLELANTKDLLQRQNSVVVPKYHACILNLSIADLGVSEADNPD